MTEKPALPRQGETIKKLSAWLEKDDRIYWVLAIFGLVGILAVAWYLLKRSSKEKPKQ
jgi:hypothetical protein